MPRSALEDAFGHHVWATLTLIEACQALSDEDLRSPVAGTYGSILDTLRHTVGADAWYLFVITAGKTPEIAEDSMDLHALASVMRAHGEAWSAVLAAAVDPDAEIVAPLEDGSEGHAPLGIRLAQALHHGTDHRSQVCTALSSLGVTPPDIDVWAYGERDGRVFDTH